MTGTTDSPEALAYHEAGHVVAALRLDLLFPSVTTRPKFDCLERVAKRRWPKGFNPEAEPLTPGLLVCLENAIVHALAGPEARCRFTGAARDAGWRADGAEPDRQQAITYAAFVVGAETRSLAAYLNGLALVTENLLALPHNWELVEHIADSLLERKRLTYRQVQEIAWGKEVMEMSDRIAAVARQQQRRVKLYPEYAGTIQHALTAPRPQWHEQ